MKNKITWFSTILLIITLGITQISFAQNATSCDSAKSFTYPINSSVSNYTNSVYWFKVTLDEGDFDIKIENLPSTGKITSAEVYTGLCSSLSLLKTDSIATPADTIFHVNIHNTVHAETYYIKLNNRGGNASFNKTMATTVYIIGQLGFCPGQQVILSALVLNPGSNPVTYAWSSGGGNGINSSPFFPTSSTNYSLVYTDGNGIITKNVTVFPLGPNECKNCEQVQNGHFEWAKANYSNPLYPYVEPQFFINPNPTGSTPDYLNSFGGAPLNPIPHSGNSYGGIYIYLNNGGTTYREYLQNQLKCPLTAGQKYDVSFYAILKNGSSLESNHLGAFLSPNVINVNLPATSNNNINVIPQIDRTNIWS